MNREALEQLAHELGHPRNAAEARWYALARSALAQRQSERNLFDTILARENRRTREANRRLGVAFAAAAIVGTAWAVSAAVQ